MYEVNAKGNHCDEDICDIWSYVLKVLTLLSYYSSIIVVSLMFPAYIFLSFDVDNIIHSLHFVNLVKNPNGLAAKMFIHADILEILLLVGWISCELVKPLQCTIVGNPGVILRPGGAITTYCIPDYVGD